MERERERWQVRFGGGGGGVRTPFGPRSRLFNIGTKAGPRSPSFACRPKLDPFFNNLASTPGWRERRGERRAEQRRYEERECV